MIKNSSTDYSLYLVTDRNLAGSRPLCQIVEAAIRGGVTIVQYREKCAGTRQMIEEARSIRDLCHTHNIPFIINDRLDIALAVNADGIHIGQEDMPASLVRKILGPEKIIGVSVENPHQALTAISEGADYVGASPIYSTPVKPDASNPIGIPGLQEIVRICSIPVVAIGGLNISNAASILQAGATGIAVVSAIINAENVEQAARKLKMIIDDTRFPGKTGTNELRIAFCKSEKI
jgi:thiamine-phosphate pyrophosphorylase